MSKTTARQHTETPWVIGSEGLSGGWIGFYARGEGKHIGRIESEDVGDVEAKANADLVVRAVNAHEALVAACKAWLEFNRETKAETPIPDLALRAMLREKAKEKSLAALKLAGVDESALASYRAARAAAGAGEEHP